MRNQQTMRLSQPRRSEGCRADLTRNDVTGVREMESIIEAGRVWG